MKKVLIEIDTLGARGGMDQYVLPFINALSNHNVKCILITNNEKSSIRLNTRITKLDFFSNFLKGKKASSLFCFLLGLVKTFAFLVFRDRKEQYAVHLHFFSYGFLDLLKILILKPFDINIHSTIHDVTSFRKDFFSKFFRNFIFNNTSILLVHNETSKSNLKTIYNGKVNITILKHGNYCDFVDCFISDDLSSEKNLNGCFDIGFIGQIKRVKNIEFIVNSLLPLKNYSLIVKGKVSEYKEDELNSLLTNKNLNCVYKFGYLANHELIESLRNLDVIILPYKEIYQSGILLLAMSSKAIVLTSNLDAFREIISDGHNGFMFEEGNQQSFQDKIMEIKNLTNKDKEKIRDNARVFVEKHHSWDLIATKYIELAL